MRINTRFPARGLRMASRGAPVLFQTDRGEHPAERLPGGQPAGPAASVLTPSPRGDHRSLQSEAQLASRPDHQRAHPQRPWAELTTLNGG